MNKPVTMRDILKALTLELGEADGKRAFEWYCTTYGVTAGDEAPGTIVYEVLGTTKEELAAGVEVVHLEGNTYRATDTTTGVSVTFKGGEFESTQALGVGEALTKKMIAGEVNEVEAAKATAAAMYRIGAFLAMHRPELVSPDL